MKLSKEKIKDIPNLIATQTVKEIAYCYNVHPATVRYWIKRLRAEGIKVVTKPGRKSLSLK